MEPLFLCTRCQQNLPRAAFHEWRGNSPQPRCANCRSIERKLRLYGTICEICNQPGKLASNNCCGSCNADQGLKECKQCHQLAIIGLSIYASKSKCKACMPQPILRQRPNRAVVRANWKLRYGSDVEFKLTTLCRNRLYKALKGKQKIGSAVRDWGCTPAELKSYIESKFEPGMTWQNWGNGHGKWNIDHIKPLASFDLSDRLQFIAAFHHTNLQPLWWEDNNAKSDKLDWSPTHSTQPSI